MMKTLLVATAAFGLAAFSGNLPAADAAAGEAKSAPCAGCHGPKGVSVNPMWPNLAGQHAAYLTKAMKDYRDGNRNDPLMSPMAQGLSDEDIENLSAYYAGLEP